MLKILKHIFGLVALIAVTSSFASVPYCKGTVPTAIQNEPLQKAVAGFSIKMNCSAGVKCLSKKPGPSGSSRFIINWELQCNPTDGVDTLMDQGRTTTFVCGEETQTGQTCCWPMGMEADKTMRECT